MSKVEILKRGDRGFHGYGPPFQDTYGSVIEVYESSAATKAHVWLKINSSSWIKNLDAIGEGTAHLNIEQTQALIDRLQTFLDEIPSRWSDE